jgi:hypothetical protein
MVRYGEIIGRGLFQGGPTVSIFTWREIIRITVEMAEIRKEASPDYKSKVLLFLFICSV